MQIFYSLTSPFARKVSMSVKILDLKNVQWQLVNPLEEEESMRKANPLGKVPALTDGNLNLCDSELICEYLNHLSVKQHGVDLSNRSSDDYFSIRLAQTLANGILEASVALVMEKRREEPEQSQYWMDRWNTAVMTALNQIDLEHCGTALTPNFATITLSSALGYLDFRHPNLEWRKNHTPLKNWFDSMSETHWFNDTLPGKEQISS